MPDRSGRIRPFPVACVTAVQFADRSFVLPSDACDDCQPAADPVIICDKAVGKRLPEVFIRIAEGNRAGIRYAEEEVREIGTGRRACEGE
jgi:hypothetical protein